MQTHIHCYGTYAFVRAAGLNAPSSQAIATAAEYVDDSDYVRAQLHDNVAVFYASLENEMKLAVREDSFPQIRQEVAMALGYQEPSKALKNLEGTTLFIKRAYERNLSIPVLEDIAEKVTLLKQNST
jgi:hypothetical protein